MKSVTVVGSGITGLTSAIRLQEKNFRVRIIAREGYDKTLSSKVGAIWFPFEVRPAKKANRWAAMAYTRYEQEQQPDNGISFIPFLTAYNAGSNTAWTQLLPEGKVRKATASELPGGMDMAYISIVPLAEPPKYLPHLFERFLKNGGEFEERTVSSLHEMASLNTLVVNCTGLGAKALCNDKDLHPMRGQILRSRKMNLPSCANSTNKGALSYVITRSEDCIIGGTDYEHDWNTNIEKSDTRLILERFEKLGLTHQQPEILEAIVGLRPRRSAVRFEFDKKYPNIFHNYGHGGAGFTVAWGCAEELTEIFTTIQ